MPGHVTFIHGIGNQRKPENLLKGWKRALADGGSGVDLDALGVTSSMIYWADVMYEEPSDARPEGESALFEGVTAGEIPELDESYIGEAAGAEKAFIEAMTSTYHLDADDTIEPPSVDDVDLERAHELEAVPLPWFLKKPLMKILLRDVHHYLFNSEHDPGRGVTYKVQDEIRNRFLDALQPVTRSPHIVVAHSMGTVITYDVLKRVLATPSVDCIITIGSPLGLSEIQDQMEPEYSPEDGYPDKTTHWHNFSDRIDPVCAADPKIANDYQQAGQETVQDVIVSNDGAFRHPVGKYFRQQSLQEALLTCLGLR